MNNLWTEIPYANSLSSKVQQFKLKNTQPYLANFRCPICGDSKKNAYKARGYVYEKNGNLFYSCKNCGASLSFINFIKSSFPDMYDDFIMEKYKTNDTHIQKIIKKEENTKSQIGIYLDSVDKLSNDHPAVLYVKSRKIPEKKYKDIYYTDNFSNYVNSYIPKKLKPVKSDPRIVFNIINKYGKLVGFVGRSILPSSKLRYITIMLTKNDSKIYGLDLVNGDNRTYVVEGIIDSLFLDNSIALVGADANLPDFIKEPIIIFDNDNRNLEIIKRVDKHISMGYSVFIWPSYIKSKDINDMVLDGYNPKEIIDQNIYSGLMANLKFIEWRKL